MPKPALFLFFIFSAFLFPLSAVSSEAAKSVAAHYLLTGEVAVVGPFNPLQVAGEPFWIVYFAPQDAKESKNLVLVVKDEGENAVLETRESLLKEVFELDFQLDALKQLEDHKASFDALDPVVQGVLVKIRSNARLGLDRITAQQDSYPALSFEDVSVALQDVEDRAQLASDRIQEGKTYQSSFSQTFYSEDLILAVEHYPSVFEALLALSDAVDTYHQKIDEKQNDVSKGKLSREVAESLSTSLESIRDVGIDASFRNFLDPRKRDYELRLSRKDSQINDTLSSFYFRKAKVEAKDAYDASRQREVPPETLLSESYRSDFEACQISTRELQGKWLSIKQTMALSSATVEQYSEIPSQVVEANALADSLAEKLRRCLQGSTPTPVPKPSAGQDNVRNFLIVAFVAIVGFLAYQFYKRQQLQAEE